jgi:hypothetical protein
LSLGKWRGAAPPSGDQPAGGTTDPALPLSRTSERSSLGPRSRSHRTTSTHPYSWTRDARFAMVKEVSAVPPSNCRDSSGPGVWGSSADVRSHGQATARVCPRKRGKFTRTLRGSAWINQVRRFCPPDGLHLPRLAYRVYALTGADTPARLDHVSRPEQRPAPRFVGRNGPLAAWRGCAVAPELEFPRELAPWIGTGQRTG